MQKPLYSSRIIDTYLKLIRKQYPHVSITDILHFAEMEPYEVADQGHWFTQGQVDRFYERAVQLTGNRAIAREAGRFAVSPDTLGAMRQYVLGLVGPLRAFSGINASTKHFVRSSDYQSKTISSSKVEIVVRSFPGVEEKPFQCENRIGFFEAIIMGFQQTTPRIEHPECMFQGGEVCRYIISWRRSLAGVVRRIRDLFLFTFALIAIASLLQDADFALHTIIPIGGFLVLVVALGAEMARSKELNRSVSALWDTADQLTEQINTNYGNTQLAREIGEVVSTKTSTEEVITSVIHVLEKSLDFDRGLVLLANEKTQRLEIRGAYGYSDDDLSFLKNTSFRLNNPNSRGPFIISFHQKKPILINDIRDVVDKMTPKSQAFVKALGIQSFISCPIVLEGKPIGILAVDNRRTKKPLVNSDVNLLLGIAPVIAMSIHNAQLLEARQEQFDSTLHVLAESIDARDFLTAGHSEKVAEYASGIAVEMHLPDNFCQMLRTAALLHDYGKIGIPDAILKKDGPLSDEERAIINTHPTKTKQILEKVNFHGIFREIPDIVLSHHERWDGAGYPNALKGEEIPLGARIISVADFYEAITSKRHYREPMLLEEALQILREESGAHFEPRIVEAFLRYLEKTRVCLLDDKAGSNKPGGGSQRLPRMEYRTQVSTRADRRIFAGSSIDISTGGLFVATTEEANIPQDSEITLTFNLPYEERLVQLQGRIIWVNAGEPRPAARLPRGFGVKFLNMSEEVMAALQTYLDTCLGFASTPDHREHLAL